MVLFRPDSLGGEGWYDGCVYAQRANLGPWESAFCDSTQAQEGNSFITYDSIAGKVKIYIRGDKNGQGQAQIKYHGIAGEAGKCYRVAFKMNANHELNGVSIKWQADNEQPAIYENKTISLEEGDELNYEEHVAGAAGNGILLFDFGFASAGDIIEIYNVTIEEEACPSAPTYYLVGTMNEWAADEAYKFAESETTAGEYVLNTTLAAGDAIKVVGINEYNEIWYPAGFNKEYVVDAAHAGQATVYFRPAGNTEWAAFGGYFYINATQAIDHVDASAEHVKFFENGQMYIRIGDKIYNALGTEVK